MTLIVRNASRKTASTCNEPLLFYFYRSVKTARQLTQRQLELFQYHFTARTLFITKIVIKIALKNFHTVVSIIRFCILFCTLSSSIICLLGCLQRSGFFTTPKTHRSWVFIRFNCRFRSNTFEGCFLAITLSRSLPKLSQANKLFKSQTRYVPEFSFIIFVII